MSTQTRNGTSTWSRRTIVVTGGAVLVLAPLAGLGIWQIDLHSRSHAGGAPAAASLARTVSQAGNSDVSVAAAAEAVTEPHDTSAPVRGTALQRETAELTPQLMLAGSAEQQQQLQSSINDADLFRSHNGSPSLNTAVIQVPAGSTETTVLRVIADENLTRVALGLKEIQVIEPNGDVATATITAASSSPDYAARAWQVTHSRDEFRVYVVASQEDADAARSAVDAADALRAGKGPASTLVQLAVVAPGDDGSSLAQAVAAENSTRATIGVPEIQVIDLRG